MLKEVIRDGHIHTPFCPHGSGDTLAAYVEEGIRLGLKEMTFTEHFPLPSNIGNSDFVKGCALDKSKVKEYIQGVHEIQEIYRNKMKINVGFEVDYVEGREKEIESLLNVYGPYMEDGILSVHFVYYGGQYYAIDYMPDVEALLEKVHSIKAIYDLYFSTVIRSIEADLGAYKPKRIGHPTLVRIFQKKWPIDYGNYELYQELVEKLKQYGYALDFNIAGLRKPYCGEPYPSGKILELVQDYEIPYVYGSDSHEVGQMAYIKKWTEK